MSVEIALLFPFLHTTIRKILVEIINIVLQCISSSLVGATDEQGMTPHTLGAYIGDFETVRTMLATDGDSAAANKEDKNGFTPIHLASRKGHITIVDLLLKHCPQPRDLLDKNKWNILHTAVWHRRDNVVKYILGRFEFQVLINQKDKFGNTPLHLAVWQGYPKTVSIIASNKRVNFSVRNSAGNSAMDIARTSLMGEKTLFLRRVSNFFNTFYFLNECRLNFLSVHNNSLN